MSNLLSELEAVVGLADKATPGPWHCAKLAHVVRKEWRDDSGNLNQIVSGQYGDDALCTTAVNFLRTHHAEIAAAVRDGQRIDWLETMANKPGGLLLHDGSESGRAGLGLRPCAANRTLREACDSAMSAREGQG